MVRQLVLLLAGWATVITATNMRRVAQIPSGLYHGSHGRVVCCDSDHDSLPDLSFHTGTIYPSDPVRIEVWEHHGWNRFNLVFADTGQYPEPPGITTGNAIPFAAGDIDDDGLTDIVCITVEPDSADPEKAYDDVITIESPDSFSYPCSLSWYFRYAENMAIPQPVYYPPDLDQDGHKEVLLSAVRIWENVGDNQNELVYSGSGHGGYRFAFGDFDMDGSADFATATLSSAGILTVWECTGDDQYQVVYQDTVRQPNGADVFMTNDIDGDGKPEFYVAYENVPRGKIYLYMWEADQAGADVYHRTLVDSVSFSGDDWGRISECGDIDGDAIDECIWTTPTQIRVYKAVGDDSLQMVWNWYSDHGGFRSLVSTVYDINNDGYNELITAGNAKISIFEVDAIDLLSPNGGSCSVGDTVEIRWRANTPPACDSISLFLRRGITPSPLPSPQGGGNRREGELTDSLWNLDTIATGLSGTDTLYRWVVPSGVPDTGRIVVVAYGQVGGDMTQSSSIGIVSQAGARNVGGLTRVAWQFDMSDSVITFIGGGVAEGTGNVPLHWSLSVSPNPARGAFTVRYDVPFSDLGHNPNSPAELGYVPSPGTVPVFALGIYDAGGRLVRSLSDGAVAPGRYEARLRSGTLPAGVYFCTLDNGAKRISRKVVLTE